MFPIFSQVTLENPPPSSEKGKRTSPCTLIALMYKATMSNLPQGWPLIAVDENRSMDNVHETPHFILSSSSLDHISLLLPSHQKHAQNIEIEVSSS